MQTALDARLLPQSFPRPDKPASRGFFSSVLRVRHRSLCDSLKGCSRQPVRESGLLPRKSYGLGTIYAGERYDDSRYSGRSLTTKWTNISAALRAALLALSGWTASHGASIVTTPPLLQPGDRYQLVFVTAHTFAATSTDIATYNANVAAEAALNPTLAVFDAQNNVTWTVIGSTATVNANVNAPSSGGVYTLDGTMVASSAQSLYSNPCPISVNMCPGPLLSPIDITQMGTPLTTSVWTGSLSSGVAAGNPSLGYDWTYLGSSPGSGGDPFGDVTQGCSSDTSSFWADCDYNPGTKLFSLYALSSVITVPAPGGAPAINRSGVVPTYSSVPVIQPGSWVSIYGTNLASGTTLWNGDFPTLLGGTSVMIDNKPAYLWSVSPFQINLQAPDDPATGLVSVAVTTGSGTATSTVTLAAYGPSFSLLGDAKHVAGEIATPNGTGAYGDGAYDLVGPVGAFPFSTRPVKPGEVLTLFGVGFGPTTPHVPAGQIFSGVASTNGPVTVTIGGLNANVSFAGITEAGLYQLNLTVPNTASGDQPLQAAVNGVQTPLGPVVTVQ